MNGDFLTILLWFVMLTGLGIAVFPILWAFLTKRLPDGGFGVSTVCAIAVMSWIAWMGSSLHILPFATAAVSLVLIALLAISAVVLTRVHEELKQWTRGHAGILLFELMLCFVSLLFWSWVRGFNLIFRD